MTATLTDAKVGNAVITDAKVGNAVLSDALYSLNTSSYFEKMIATNPLVYFPLNEIDGTTAINYGTLGTAANGTYSGPTLANAAGPDGQPVPYFAGVNQSVNIFSAALSAAFNGQEGTFMIWVKGYIPTIWSDNTERKIFELYADASNRMYVAITATNVYSPAYAAVGNWINPYFITNESISGWQNIAITWSKSANKFRSYVNGIGITPVDTVAGSWVAALTYAVVGCQAGGGNHWKGWLSNIALWNTALTGSQIRQLTLGQSIPFRLMIDFDDGNASLMNAYAYMQARSLKGNAIIVTSLVDTAGIVTHANLQTLYSNGWGIVNHTRNHPNLTTLSEADQEIEITNGKNDLNGWGLTRCSNHLAFPGGSYNADTLTAMNNLGTYTGRLFGANMVIDPVITNLPVINIAWWAKSINDLASAQAIINEGIERGGYMILVFHGIDDGWGDGMWTTAKFQSFIDWIVVQNITCATRDDFYNG